MWQNFLLLNSDRKGEACLDASILFPGMTFPIRSLPGSHHRLAPRALLLYLAAPSMICYPGSALASVCSGICGCSWRCCSDADQGSGLGTSLSSSLWLAPPTKTFVCSWALAEGTSHPTEPRGHTDVSKVQMFLRIFALFFTIRWDLERITADTSSHIAPCVVILLGHNRHSWSAAEEQGQPPPWGPSISSGPLSGFVPLHGSVVALHGTALPASRTPELILLGVILPSNPGSPPQCTARNFKILQKIVNLFL